MQALVLTTYGGPEATEIRRDVAAPETGPRDVLVQVRAAGLNPVDFKTRQGMLKVILPYSLPIVMGNEIAGEVAKVGNEVTRFAPGDRVYARLEKSKMGGFAELTTVEEQFLAKMPATLDFDAAGAVPLAALTALQSLRDELKVAPGMRVLITGGAGGVGTFAIPIAKHLGAEVATTASPRGEALVRRLGPDIVIDYTRERFEERLRDYDGVFDLVGGDDLLRSFSIVRPGGTVVSVAGIPEPQTAYQDLGRGWGLAALFWAISLKVRRQAARHGVHYRYKFMHPSGTDLEFIADLIDQGKLKVVLDRVFPFEQVLEAMAHLETGLAKGKVVVTMAN